MSAIVEPKGGQFCVVLNGEVLGEFESELAAELAAHSLNTSSAKSVKPCGRWTEEASAA